MQRIQLAFVLHPYLLWAFLLHLNHLPALQKHSGRLPDSVVFENDFITCFYVFSYLLLKICFSTDLRFLSQLSRSVLISVFLIWIEIALFVGPSFIQLLNHPGLKQQPKAAPFELTPPFWICRVPNISDLRNWKPSVPRSVLWQTQLCSCVPHGHSWLSLSPHVGPSPVCCTGTAGRGLSSPSLPCLRWQQRTSCSWAKCQHREELLQGMGWAWLRDWTGRSWVGQGTREERGFWKERWSSAQ